MINEVEQFRHLISEMRVLLTCFERMADEAEYIADKARRLASNRQIDDIVIEIAKVEETISDEVPVVKSSGIIKPRRGEAAAAQNRIIRTIK